MLSFVQMAEEFRKGDVVKLKSGGPLMTVSNIGEYLGEQKVWCVWFEKTKKFEETFAPEVLAIAGSPTGFSGRVVRS